MHVERERRVHAEREATMGENFLMRKREKVDRKRETVEREREREREVCCT